MKPAATVADVELLAQLAVLALKRVHLDRAADDRVQLVVVEWLGYAIEGATARSALPWPICAAGSGTLSTTAMSVIACYGGTSLE